jgi:predicted lipoprotein with Yx(FWY)xxD motif
MVIAAGALVAACSSSSGAGAPTVSSVAPAAASPAAAQSSDAKSAYGAAAATPVAAAGGIALASTKLGMVLVGPTGLTFYMFTPDTKTTSACNGGCATAWPPLTGDLPALGTGLDKEDFGTLTRGDGTTQITFYGHALYYFGGDKAAGDTNGQGLNQKWYVLGSDGNPIGAAAASPAASAAASQAASSGGLALAKVGLGTVLVGPTGMTLYMFAPDTKTSSACSGGCATAWPPLTGDLPALGTGLDKEDFGSVTRDDGTKQVTFYGHPLYYFGGDKAAGDTNGQGLNQKWYVLGSDGNPIK